MNFINRTNKSQKKVADQMMSISTSLFTATIGGVLVVPLTAFVTSLLSSSQKPISFFSVFERMTWSDVIIFFFLYLSPVAAAALFRRAALNIHDRLSNNAAPKA